MAAHYDQDVTSHYNKIAEDHGLSPQSTMADEVIRTKETKVITEFVSAGTGRGKHRLTIIDVGCGNGYTLSQLAGLFPGCDFIGLEYNEKLRDLAVQQVRDLTNVRILPGDIRNRVSIAIEDGVIDILLCQRVLINLLSDQDARAALDNLVSLVGKGGKLLFAEAFSSGLANLNAAREEFRLGPIPPAHHNMYLDDDFFNRPDLEEIDDQSISIPRNLLSTHYFVTRVLHAAFQQAQGDGSLKRNSHFVKFFSAALPDALGEYAPVQFRMFTKAGSR